MAKKIKMAMESAISPVAKNNIATTIRNPEKITPAIITGYQYGDGGAFIGEYQFEKNLDKEDVHCPPCTVLCAPPVNLSVDEEVFFDGERWAVRKLTLPWLPDQELSVDEEETNHGN